MTTAATGFPTDTDDVASVPAVPRLRRPLATLLASLGLGVCAEVFFDGPALGISLPLFVALLLAALLGLGGREGWQRARPNAWLLVPLLFFSGMVFVRASPFLTTLNVLATGFLLLLVTHFWAAGRVERLGLWSYPFTALGAFFHAALMPPGVLRAEVDLSAARRQVPKLMPVVRGALLAVPVLFVFTALLVSADAVFEAAVARVLSFSPGLTFLDAVGRLVFVGGSAFGVLGLLAHAQRRRRNGAEAGEAEVAPVQTRLGFVECLTLVGLVDLLFLGFAAIQFAFLFGAAQLPARFISYSEYARRGFFELLAVSMMTLGLSMALARWTRLRSEGQVTAFRVACSVMVGLVLVILASAMKRMALYESAYGYTHLRVYTHVFMVALAGVLVWRAVTLWWRPERFAIGAFVGALGFLAALNVLNPDAFIARGNLERAAEGHVLDEMHMVSLSEDAAPELAARMALAPDSTLARSVHGMFCRFSEPMPGGWPAFHLARHRAATWARSLECPVSLPESVSEELPAAVVKPADAETEASGETVD
ncbi:DUF4153 domain-containing protein [Archangium violaceum]|uniref:Uncharacterized protein n=1 Tax=Archangium violaceum Cb vi76 TaxID=1406225 RepID=A0A084SYJ6_9BACT|nr:DUF4173 domain-containing protein [Archangium violaceum]KFA93531.1 hypothetical protein Q664_08705 [Archangium violaceum Cb vi76]